eukprot:403362351
MSVVDGTAKNMLKIDSPKLVAYSKQLNKIARTDKTQKRDKIGENKNNQKLMSKSVSSLAQLRWVSSPQNVGDKTQKRDKIGENKNNQKLMSKSVSSLAQLRWVSSPQMSVVDGTAKNMLKIDSPKLVAYSKQLNKIARTDKTQKRDKIGENKNNQKLLSKSVSSLAQLRWVSLPLIQDSKERQNWRKQKQSEITVKKCLKSGLVALGFLAFNVGGRRHCLKHAQN